MKKQDGRAESAASKKRKAKHAALVKHEKAAARDIASLETWRKNTEADPSTLIDPRLSMEESNHVRAWLKNPLALKYRLQKAIKGGGMDLSTSLEAAAIMFVVANDHNRKIREQLARDIAHLKKTAEDRADPLYGDRDSPEWKAMQQKLKKIRRQQEADEAEAKIRADFLKSVKETLKEFKNLLDEDVIDQFTYDAEIKPLLAELRKANFFLGYG